MRGATEKQRGQQSGAVGSTRGPTGQRIAGDAFNLKQKSNLELAGWPCPFGGSLPCGPKPRRSRDSHPERRGGTNMGTFDDTET